MKVGGTIERLYRTSEIAKIVNVHPNTVRMYEELNLIPKAKRYANGYRAFTDLHIDQFILAQTGFKIEILQNGLRKKIIKVINLSASLKYDEAIVNINEYINSVEKEIKNAKEAILLTKELLQNSNQEATTFLKRKQVSDLLGITIDTLRNWEMNGLIKVKRKENGYRIYTAEDIKRLKIIRSLKCANYSLSAILRMLNSLEKDKNCNLEHTLNTPHEDEEIVSVSDKLVISLNSAKNNAQLMLTMLNNIKTKYTNPPL